MKIFITSNTLFGYKKHFGFTKFLENSEKYFNQELIPFLQKYSQPDDIFIHLGNMFSSKQTLNVKVIKNVQNIFSNIANILPTYILIGENDRYNNDNEINTLSVLKNIKNIFIIEQSIKIKNILLLPYSKDINLELLKFDDISYLFFNNNIKDILSYQNKIKSYSKVYSGYFSYNKAEFNYKNIGSPYQIEPANKNCGIIVLDTIKNEDKFIFNKTTSKIETIKINNIEELININKEYFNNNLVDIVLNKELYDNKEFQIKLSEYKIKDIIFNNIENGVINNENDLDLDDIKNIFNIDELINSKINENVKLKNEFENILKIVNE